jgi:transposase-like protein
VWSAPRPEAPWASIHGRQAGRRIFSTEFRRDTVRRMLTGEKTMAELSRELDIAPSVIRNWKRFAKAGATTAVRRRCAESPDGDGAVDDGDLPGPRLGPADRLLRAPGAATTATRAATRRQQSIGRVLSGPYSRRCGRGALPPGSQARPAPRDGAGKSRPPVGTAEESEGKTGRARRTNHEVDTCTHASETQRG